MGYFTTAIVHFYGAHYCQCTADLGYWDLYFPILGLRISTPMNELEGESDIKITHKNGEFRMWVRLKWNSSSLNVRPAYTITRLNKDVYFNDIGGDL